MPEAWGSWRTTLAMSEGHIHWLESQVNVIQKVGLNNYLVGQIGKARSVKKERGGNGLQKTPAV